MFLNIKTILKANRKIFCKFDVSQNIFLFALYYKKFT